MRELVCPRHMCKVPLGKCMEWDIDEVTGERIQCNEKPVIRKYSRIMDMN